MSKVVHKEKGYVSGPDWAEQADELQRKFRICEGDDLFVDEAWAVSSRLVLKPCLSSLKKGDVLCVTALFRLGLDANRFVNLLADLKERSVFFVSIAEGVDTREARFGFSKTMENLAQSKRALELEKLTRMRVHRDPDSYVGGPDPKISRETMIAIVEYMNEDTFPHQKIADMFKVSRSRCLGIFSDFKKGLLPFQRKGKNRSQIIRENECLPEMTKNQVTRELKRLSRRRS